MEPQQKASGLKAELIRRLKDPFQLRLFVTSLVLLAGFALYVPLSNDTDEAAAKLAAAQKRLALAKDVEQLRSQFKKFKKRLPEKTDSNEWVNYMLKGIRAFPLKLNTLDYRPPQDLGAFQVIVLRIDLDGSYRHLHSFLCWLEGNERFFRVESLSLVPNPRNKELLHIQLTVMGVMG